MERIPTNRFVSLTIDMQKDFLDGGSLAVPEGDTIIETINDITHDARTRNDMIIFTGDQHPPVTEHFKKWPPHCVAGTDGAAFARDLDVRYGDFIINKGMGQTDGYSGMEGYTSEGFTIEQLIQPYDKQHVVVAISGVAINYCVLETALDILRLQPTDGDITLLLLLDAMKGIDAQPGDSEAAIQQMIAAGAIGIHSDDLLKNNLLDFIEED